jgi:hypothetical protein
MKATPIVYVGPSLQRREAEAALPGCEVRGPVRRGDLYRAREAHGSIFVLLDGVFYQNVAVSPREVLDVIADGALVVGAASLGALRAAECWPAGMLGVGAIYRLFRRAALGSDDEVALTFTPGPEYEPLSVPLVNVRHALRRAARAGRLERALAGRIVRSAEETFYADRTWPAILERAGVPTAEREPLAALLAVHDLKKQDALHALRTVARWLAADPALGHRPRRDAVPFRPTDSHRESPHDALAGEPPQDVRRQLARWHLLSGRSTGSLLAVAAAHPEAELAQRMERHLARMPVLQELLVPERIDGRALTGEERAALGHPAGLRLVLSELWAAAAADEAAFAERLWAELSLSRELDAEIFRWLAVRDGAREARRLGLQIGRRERWLAETEIAQAHGFHSWSELRRVCAGGPIPWREWITYRDELALAKRLRERLFNPMSDSA